MLHLFNNDLNFSTKLLLEPVYLKVYRPYNGHDTYTAPDSAIFSHQHLSVASDISERLYVAEGNGCDS